MARSDSRPRFFAIGLMLAATACGQVQRTSATPVIVPADLATPTTDPSLGTRARIVPLDPLPTDPEGLRILALNFSKPSVEPDDDAPSLTREALEDTALGEARGLSIDGGIHAAKLEETQRVTMPIEAAPGDCFTVVAHGGLGVMEVDAFIVRRGTARALAQDTRNGPIAVVGGMAGCWPFVESPSTELDVLVQARKGRGPVVFAVYVSRAAEMAPGTPER